MLPVYILVCLNKPVHYNNQIIHKQNAHMPQYLCSKLVSQGDVGFMSCYDAANASDPWINSCRGIGPSSSTGEFIWIKQPNSKAGAQTSFTDKHCTVPQQGEQMYITVEPPAFFEPTTTVSAFAHDGKFHYDDKGDFPVWNWAPSRLPKQ